MFNLFGLLNKKYTSFHHYVDFLHKSNLQILKSRTKPLEIEVLFKYMW